MKKKLLSRGALLGGLMFMLPACEAPPDDLPAREPAEPTKPFDVSALMSPSSVRKQELSLGSALGAPVATGNTCGKDNAYTPSCSFSSAPDVSFTWTAPSSGRFTFATSGGFDTVLHVYDAVSGAPLGCNDDDGGTLQSIVSISVNAGQQLRLVVDGFAGICGGFGLNITSYTGAPVKKAMTWSLLSSATPDASRAYVLVGSDGVTNTVSGDTFTDQVLPILCIRKSGLPTPGPGVIGTPITSPGERSRRTWSGGTAALSTPVAGNSLTSYATANAVCSSQFGLGYRMAEFSDGDPLYWGGWDFWAEARGNSLTPFRDTRFWVAIHGRNANPW